jgi:hypothetical protein
MNYQDFSFVVEQMTDAQAKILMDYIVAFVEARGLTMGGGFRPTTDADYPEADDEQNA